MQRSKPESMPRMNPERRNPEPQRAGRTSGQSLFGYFFAGPAPRRLEKVTRRKGGTLTRHHPKNGSTPKPQEPGRPTGRQGKKKGQPKSPKMPCVLINPEESLLALIRVLPDKNSNPAKNRTMRPTVSTPAKTTLSKNMTGLLNLLCCDGAKLTKHAGAIIDQDQVRPTQNAKEGK